MSTNFEWSGVMWWRLLKASRLWLWQLFTLLIFVLEVDGEFGFYEDFIRILKVHPGSALKSAFTIDISPKLANAPRSMPQGKWSMFDADCFDSISSEAYRSSHLNRKSDKTKTPLWFVCNLSIWQVRVIIFISLRQFRKNHNKSGVRGVAPFSWRPLPKIPCKWTSSSQVAQ